MAEPWMSLLQSVAETLLGLIPRWILSLAYPTKKLRERVQILSCGVGPHMYVTDGKRLAIDPIPVAVHNALPFDLEIEELQGLAISLESTSLTEEFDKSLRRTAAKRAITRLSFGYGLTDNQAAIIRKYPSQCPILKVHGNAHFKAPFRTFSVDFSLETRAYRYEAV